MREQRANSDGAGAGPTRKKKPIGNTPSPAEFRPKAKEWACVEMQSAGFPGAVRPDLLCRVLEGREDGLIEEFKFPERVVEGIEVLRKLSERFAFDDAYLRPRPFERFDNPDDGRNFAACRFALAFDRPDSERLLFIVSRAYRRTCEYARFLRGDATSNEKRWQTSAKLAETIALAMEKLSGEKDPTWGRYLSRGDAWKGGPLREGVDYMRGKIHDDSAPLKVLDEFFLEIDAGLVRIQQMVEFLRSESDHDKKIVCIDEREFFILRIMEIYVLSTRKKPSFDLVDRQFWR